MVGALPLATKKKPQSICARVRRKTEKLGFPLARRDSTCESNTSSLVHNYTLIFSWPHERCLARGTWILFSISARA